MPSTEYKTCRRIEFACDDDNQTSHIELQWNGQTVFLDITDDKIVLGGPAFVVKQASVNTLEITAKYPRTKRAKKVF